MVNRTSIYIDGNNLHRGSKELGFSIDYKKFRGWLRQKFNVQKVYLFIGLVPDNVKFYQYLQECGFILVFKQTVTVSGIVKGNCDAELVLKVVSDFYEKDFNDCVLITGDGDFGCVIDFMKDKRVFKMLLAPNKNKCSMLLKNKFVPTLFLNDQYHKFEKRKAPDADVSAKGPLL